MSAHGGAGPGVDSRPGRVPQPSRREPLWDRIDRNRLKTAAFIVVFTSGLALSAAIFVAVIGTFLGFVLVPQNETVTFFGALPWIVLAALVAGAAGAGAHVVRSLSDPHRRLPRLFGATLSEVGTFLPTKSALHDMAIASGLEHSPPLWVIDDERVNAFVVGMNQRDAVVGVTRGMTERIGADEQRAVFANLMARLCSGDVIWSTAVSAVMGPIWHARSAQMRRQDDEDAQDGAIAAGARAAGSAWEGPLFLAGTLAVVFTEALMAGHERAALLAAEKADAEGMLLLKDPRAMLDALTHVLGADNTVSDAGEEYSMLFYCWAGFGYAPEDDPEMARIERLRQTLGVQGA